MSFGPDARHDSAVTRIISDRWRRFHRRAGAITGTLQTLEIRARSVLSPLYPAGTITMHRIFFGRYLLALGWGRGRSAHATI